MKRYFSQYAFGVLVGSLAVALLLTGCAPATDPAPTPKNGTLSGKVYNKITGQPISGASIMLGSTTATSSATGAFSLDFGQSSGIASKALTVFATGYQATYVSNLSVDTGSSYVRNINLDPLDTSAYSKVAISGRVYEKQTDASTPTELSSTWTIHVTVMNKFGHQRSTSFSYANGTGFDTGNAFYRLTSDSLVYLFAYPPSGSTQHGFGVIATGVDLSGASATFDATEDLTIEKTVALTADGSLTGNLGVAPYSFYMAQVALVTPYGNLSQIQATSGSASSVVMFTGSTTVSASYVNPSSYPVSLTQMKSDVQSATFFLTQATLAPGATIGSTAILPAISSAVTLTAAPDASSIAYDPASGTLSITPVSGASYYGFTLQDDTSKAYVATITSTSASFSLSPTLKAALSGKTINVSSVYCAKADFPLDMDSFFQSPTKTLHVAQLSSSTSKSGVSF